MTHFDAHEGVGPRSDALASGPPQTLADRWASVSRESWEKVGAAWGRHTEAIERLGSSVARWMLDRLDLGPGQTVLELGAGTGDIGLRAARSVLPGGTVICTDFASSMLDAARVRAEAAGVRNVEFRELDMDALGLNERSVDRVACRWALQLSTDPATVLEQAYRVTRPGGKVAFAVWDEVERNPWSLLPKRVLADCGLEASADPAFPGAFALGVRDKLAPLFQSAGFVDVVVDTVDVVRSSSSVERYVEETVEISAHPFSAIFGPLAPERQREVRELMAEYARAFTDPDGWVRLQGRSHVVAAGVA